MAADDFAMLVGISKYPNLGFSNLAGPSKDVALMKKWLVDPAGGAVPDDKDHIVTIQSPDPYPQVDDPDQAPPVSDSFDVEFRKLLRKRMALGTSRVKGRLYLYFSGHGFCNRTLNRDSEAALYAANATKEYYDHIFGTQYARVAKGKALFQEIVLIMDCCRDAEITRPLTARPYPDTPDDSLAANTQLMAIYAVAKGGKAQERPIPERGGDVHGLLTHALITALDEARPTQANGISSIALRNHILQTWDTVCAPEPPPRPEILPPGTGDIIFAARNAGAQLSIDFKTVHPPGTILVLRDHKLQKIALFSATGNAADDIVAGGGPVIASTRENSKLLLRLQPGLYSYALSTPGSTEVTLTVPGAANVSV